ncbi:MAG TPA: hypothetical protein VFU37_23485, partial [Pyrinomonadaceae bacterium]|nr:hypothetical protein [Pyrinomonadaceae bacterium]
MAELSEHPSVKRFHQLAASERNGQPSVLEASELRQLCLKAGAHDVGFVDVDRPELASEKQDILTFFPHT